MVRDVREDEVLTVYDVVAPLAWPGAETLRPFFIGTAWTVERAAGGEPIRILVKVDVLPHGRGLVRFPGRGDGTFELVPRLPGVTETHREVHVPKTPCRQHGATPCAREAEWPCRGCQKPVCRLHRFFSETHLRPRGLRLWHPLCATCFALEQHARKGIAEITREERLAFFAQPEAQRLLGDWDHNFVEEHEGRRSSRP